MRAFDVGERCVDVGSDRQVHGLHMAQNVSCDVVGHVRRVADDVDELVRGDVRHEQRECRIGVGEEPEKNLDW